MGGIIGGGHRVTNARTNTQTNERTTANERSACCALPNKKIIMFVIHELK